MNNLYKILFCFLILFTGISLFAQEEEDINAARLVPAEEIRGMDRLRIAQSDPNYPVTPGDIYRLSFFSGDQVLTSELLVEGDFSINLNLFGGKINAKGLRFLELKPEIEKIIANVYPKGLPSLNIVSVGLFQVMLSGSLSRSQYFTAWGLTRLNDVVSSLPDEEFSVRKIGIRHEGEEVVFYDNFKGIKSNIREENPYISAGDEIIFYPVEREVIIRGEVLYPGKYQLTDEETIDDLITFAGGLRNTANASRIKVSRVNAAKMETLYYNADQAEQTGIGLQNGDIVSINSIIEKLPVIIIEGAINTNETTEVTETTDEEGIEISRIIRPFVPGETLLDLVLGIKDTIKPLADLEGCYLIRQDNEQPLNVNLEDILYNNSEQGSIVLSPFDKLIIPDNPNFVTVSGAVFSPSSLPYFPGKTYMYYINLTGGIDPEINTDNRVTIFDQEGNILPVETPIPAGSRIYVHNNSFIHKFNINFPVIATSLGIILTIVQIVTLFE